MYTWSLARSSSSSIFPSAGPSLKRALEICPIFRLFPTGLLVIMSTMGVQSTETGNLASLSSGAQALFKGHYEQNIRMKIIVCSCLSIGSGDSTPHSSHGRLAYAVDHRTLGLYGQGSNRRHIERSYTKSETMVRLATG